MSSRNEGINEEEEVSTQNVSPTSNQNEDYQHRLPVHGEQNYNESINAVNEDLEHDQEHGDDGIYPDIPTEEGGVDVNTSNIQSIIRRDVGGSPLMESIQEEDMEEIDSNEDDHYNNNNDDDDMEYPNVDNEVQKDSSQSRLHTNTAESNKSSTKIVTGSDISHNNQPSSSAFSSPMAFTNTKTSQSREEFMTVTPSGSTILSPPQMMRCSQVSNQQHQPSLPLAKRLEKEDTPVTTTSATSSNIIATTPSSKSHSTTNRSDTDTRSKDGINDYNISIDDGLSPVRKISPSSLFPNHPISSYTRQHHQSPDTLPPPPPPASSSVKLHSSSYVHSNPTSAPHSTHKLNINMDMYMDPTHRDECDAYQNEYDQQDGIEVMNNGDIQIRKSLDVNHAQDDIFEKVLQERNITKDESHLSRTSLTSYSPTSSSQQQLQQQQHQRQERYESNNTTHLNLNTVDSGGGVPSDSSSESVNSLVSEYGSDVGDVKLRLDDVRSMDVVPEEENDDQPDEDEEEYQEYQKDRLSHEKGHTNRTPEKSSQRNNLPVQAMKQQGDTARLDMAINEGGACSPIETTSTLRDSKLDNDSSGLSYDDTVADSQSDTFSYQDDWRDCRHHSTLREASHLNHDETPSTPIAAVKSAIRRYATGVSNMKTFSKSPQATSRIISPQIHTTQHPTSPSLRSLNLDLSSPTKRANMLLSPRFDSSSSSSRHHAKQEARRFPFNDKLSSPLRHMTSCLSFNPESGSPPYANMRMNDSPPASPIYRSKSWDIGGSTRNDFYDAGNNKMFNNHKSNHFNSGSKLFPGLSAASTGGAFRNHGESIMMRGQPLPPTLSPGRRNALLACMGQPSATGTRASPSPASSHNHQQHDARKVLLHPLSSSGKEILAPMFLQNSQRVGDIEKEDALDILALLVERSVAFHDKTDKISHSIHTSPKKEEEKNQEVEKTKDSVEESKVFPPTTDTSPKLKTPENSGKDSEIYEHIDALRHISEENGNDVCHTARMKALDELLRSYTYAIEMKRAALSASTWLQAIGRSSNKKRTQHETKLNGRIPNSVLPALQQQLNMTDRDYATLLTEKDELNRRLDKELSICRAEIGRLKTAAARSEAANVQLNKSIIDDEADEDSSVDSSEPQGDEIIAVKQDLLIAKAQLEEANQQIYKLQHCDRANVNCDEDDMSRDDDMVADGKESEDAKPDNDEKDAEMIEKGMLSPTITFKTNDELKKDLNEYVQMLQKEDRLKIESLQAELKEKIYTTKNNDEADKKMINVKMLDSENFETDWDLIGALPPPPEHELNSPIVKAVLSQWTDDVSIQNALFSWIEKVANGADPVSLPPLRISNLDHQVRDGFITHILPLLLRRSDIHVKVKSRAQRRTSYDLEVMVDCIGDGTMQVANREDRLAKNTHLMTFQANGGIVTVDDSGETIQPEVETRSTTHSSITTYASNQSMNSGGVQRPPKAEKENIENLTSGVSNITIDGQTKRSNLSGATGVSQHQQQSSIMAGAINAVGGFLTRKKTSKQESHRYGIDELPGSKLNQSHQYLSTKDTPTHVPEVSTSSTMMNASYEKEDILRSNISQDFEQPYHRVVSAPPGKIGLTFVQYRGHAVISDVQNSSPVYGWVFPNDILIAIDEVPVSGMRVQDIVKVLTTRRDRQRALRVISSHTDFS